MSQFLLQLPQRPGGGSGIHRRVGMVALIVASVVGCAADPKIDVFLVTMAPVQSSVLEQRVGLKLRLQNSSDADINATGVAVQINVNGRRLATGVSNEPIIIPRLGEATTTVVASASLFDVLRQIMSVATEQRVAYTLSGRLYTDGVRRRRFTKSGEFTRTELERMGMGTRAAR